MPVLDRLSTLMFTYDFRPEPSTFGTYVSPTRFIPLKSPDELAAEGRREAAQQALAVLRGATVPYLEARSVRRGMPCASCAFRQPSSPPPRFQLPPFDFTELGKPHWAWDDLHCAVPPMPYPPVPYPLFSSVI